MTFKSFGGLMLACLFAAWAPVQAQDKLLIPHVDKLQYDPAMTLGEVIEAATSNFPRSRLAEAFREQARAWDRRSGGILAGPVMLGVSYAGDQVGDDTGQWGIDTDLTFMLWKWGQKSAAHEMADESALYARKFQEAMKLQVAGLVREALWDMALKRADNETARRVLEVSERLTEAVRKRVDAGDLPRTDLLLAETDLLKRRAQALTAEAEWMHARRRYLNLTRLERAPLGFKEILQPVESITPAHPLIAAATARIQQMKALVRWSRFESDTGNQQVYFSVGSRHQHAERGGPTNHGIAANLTIPFGGGRYQAPNVAEQSVALAEAEAARGDLKRRLERDLHEAEHNLEVDQVQLEAAKIRRELAQQNLSLARQAFDVGEMDLIDLLRLQVLAQEAIRDHRRWQLRVEMDVARYNQAVGVLP